MSIFDKRIAIKPFEYPEALKFSEAINHSYWLVSEWNFISDVQDFHVKLTDVERNAIKNALLAISQIEVAVKRFWIKLGDRFQKPEFDITGVTFGESENRHLLAYAKLLEILGLNNEFDLLLQNPVIQGRVDYLTKYLKGAADNANENYMLTLALFSLFIENVSLFSQFLVIKAFRKHRNMLKDVDNVVDATMKEETIHALFGVYLVNELKHEFPDWFNEDFYNKIYRACKKAYDAEEKIIDWIFEKGELSFLSKDTVKEFIKLRFNESIEMIGGKQVFEIDKERIKEVQWFCEEIYADTNTDFFHKKPTSYSKRTQAIKAEDIF